MTALTPIRVRDCTCPETPHDGHYVFLSPTIDLEGGILAEAALIEHRDNITELTRRWLPIFVRHGAKDWDLCDAEGNPIPFDVEALLADFSIARPVADAAADMYREAVLAPFRTARRTRSPTTPTVPMTSARGTRTRKSRASR